MTGAIEPVDEVRGPATTVGVAAPTVATVATKRTIADKVRDMCFLRCWRLPDGGEDWVKSLRAPRNITATRGGGMPQASVGAAI
jgi:hypothetical protein